MVICSVKDVNIKRIINTIMDKHISPLDVLGLKTILFKMSLQVQNGQFDSRSFVGDIALELRSLLFENDESFWKEYDEWRLKEK